MSLPEEPVPVLPSFSFLYCNTHRLREAVEAVEAFMGSPVMESGEYPFDMSDYYIQEMGGEQRRKWYCYGLRDPSALAGWKHRCIQVEAKCGGEGSRKVNIDPGYLDHGKLVLASCKYAPDKIYLSQGVYAHKCLRYRFGSFHGPDHSFADFIDGRFNGFFLEARRLYRRMLRERKN